jgi:hypothetical protein
VAQNLTSWSNSTNNFNNVFHSFHLCRFQLEWGQTVLESISWQTLCSEMSVQNLSHFLLIDVWYKVHRNKSCNFLDVSSIEKEFFYLFIYLFSAIQEYYHIWMGTRIFEHIFDALAVHYCLCAGVQPTELMGPIYSKLWASFQQWNCIVFHWMSRRLLVPV